MEYERAEELVWAVYRRATLRAQEALRHAHAEVMHSGGEEATRYAWGRVGELRRSATPGQGGRLHRPLEDWYRSVHANATAALFGLPSQIIGADQIERETAHLRTFLRNAHPHDVLREVVAAGRAAEQHAFRGAAEAYRGLPQAAHQRALTALPDRPGSDPIRREVLRQWYQRAFLHAVDPTVAQRPEMMIADAEIRLVAKAVHTRELRPVLGHDGVPLVTTTGQLAADAERRAVVGPRDQWGVSPQTTLRGQVYRAWAQLPPESRRDIAKAAGYRTKRDQEIPDTWSALPRTVQETFIARYLGSQRRVGPTDPTSAMPVLGGPPEAAAAHMFGRPAPGERTPDLAREVAVRRERLERLHAASSRVLAREPAPVDGRLGPGPSSADQVERTSAVLAEARASLRAGPRPPAAPQPGHHRRPERAPRADPDRGIDRE